MDNYDAAWYATFVPGALFLVYGYLTDQPDPYILISIAFFVVSLIVVSIELIGSLYTLFKLLRRMGGEER